MPRRPRKSYCVYKAVIQCKLNNLANFQIFDFQLPLSKFIGTDILGQTTVLIEESTIANE